MTAAGEPETAAELVEQYDTLVALYGDPEHAPAEVRDLMTLRRTQVAGDTPTEETAR